MLDDPQARALAENFGGQWLQFRALESVDAAIASSSPTSTTTCASRCGARPSSSSSSIVREDRSILDFLDGTYSFLNERLARHYGIAGVTGPEFRRVDLTGHEARRGADAGERAHRLLVRDAHLAGAARQVGAREPSGRAAARAAARRAEPRRQAAVGTVGVAAPAARGSTARIRPARRATRAWTRSASASRTSTPSAPGAPRTASSRSTPRASCPTGGRSTGPRELKTILTRATATRSPACLTDKLLTYALGRGLERYDRRTGRRPSPPASASRLPVLEPGAGIVNSLPFQMRGRSRRTRTSRAP